ncbi:MAG: heat-inducible transcriptional repressor HrcA [candidate division KSB1 bacterium]|nr:heat-inducible transcriptional repressor HrcA [candidate division KSB1 bacterium]
MAAAAAHAVELTARERLIFESIVKNFIESATPVGSRFLTKKYRLGLSPATVRNIMADLEEKGLIRQPHTSAGRVPTDLGYRVYVDQLMRREKLSPGEKAAIVRSLRTVSRDVEIILEKASRLLGRISSQLGVVLAPRFLEGVLERIELVPVASRRVLVVLTVKSGLVRTVLMEIDSDVPPQRLETIARLMNERLQGLTLKQLKEQLAERTRDLDEADRGLVNMFGRTAEEVLRFDTEAHYHVSGTQNILSQPEFSDREKMRKILELLESKEIIIQVLQEGEEEGRISITIGEENEEELLRNCSLVTATYRVGSLRGTLGVIGPTRMPYARVVALVDFMARTLPHVMGC